LRKYKYNSKYFGSAKYMRKYKILAQIQNSLAPPNCHLDTNDSALVHNLLDEASVLADHLADEGTRDLKKITAKEGDRG
jgi:hypothetical protein